MMKNLLKSTFLIGLASMFLSYHVLAYDIPTEIQRESLV